MTIPIEIRKNLRLEEGSYLSIVQVGNAIILTPKKVVAQKVRKAINRIMKKEGVTLDNLLEGLKEERAKYTKEKYCNSW